MFSIAVFNSIVYFVNWWGTGEVSFSTIQQLPLRDLSARKIIYNGSNEEKQDSLFYDTDTQQLYWSDSKRDAILRCRIPCEQPITVLSIEFEDNLGMWYMIVCQTYLRDFNICKSQKFKKKNYISIFT